MVYILSVGRTLLSHRRSESALELFTGDMIKDSHLPGKEINNFLFLTVKTKL